MDTVSIVSAFLAAYVSLTLAQRTTSLRTAQKIISCWCGAIVLYCVTIYLVHPNSELFYVVRYLRMTLQLFGCLALFRLMQRDYGDSVTAVVPRMIFCAIAIHAVIMLGMYVSSSLRVAIWSLTEPDFQRAKRVGGLVGALDSLSAVQAFGLVLSLIYWPVYISVLRVGLHWIGSIATLFSIIVSGRTGIVLASAVLLVWSTIRIENTKRLIVWAMIVAAATAGSLFVFTVDPDVEKRFAGQIDRLLVLLQGESSYSARATARRKLEADYRLGWPKDTTVFVFGNSRSGRTEHYRLPYDPGWILDMHGIGLFGSLLCMAFYIYSAYIFGIAWRLDRALSASGFFWTIFVLATHSKVQFALSRLSLTVSAMLLLSAFYLAARERGHRWILWS